MKNINLIHGLFEKEKGSNSLPLFFSDAKTIKDFVKDTKQYFDYHPSGYYPYELEVEEILENKGMIYTKIFVTFTNHCQSWTNEYFIYGISYVTKNKGIDLKWIKKNDK
ncbi:MAG: hypothetical protein GY849_00640 [Deltaproteobacteria bacterium]|nr:hypothetical protein [Deltaproteobacteria bacterium]